MTKDLVENWFHLYSPACVQTKLVQLIRSKHMDETSLICMLPFIPLFFLFWLHFKSWNSVPQRLRQKLSFDRNPLLYPADQEVGVIAVGSGGVCVRRTYKMCLMCVCVDEDNHKIAKKKLSFRVLHSFTSEPLASFLSNNDTFGTGRRKQLSVEQSERKVKYSSSQTRYHSFLPPCTLR